MHSRLAAIIVITGILNLAVKDKLFLGKDFFMSVRASAGRLMGTHLYAFQAPFVHPPRQNRPPALFVLS